MSDNAKRFFVEITDTASMEVAKSMGPMTERRAEQVHRGASINLNHDRYHVAINTHEEKETE